MSLYYFNLLSPEVQLRYTLDRGTYLASRWEDDGALPSTTYPMRDATTSLK